ncbi:MAG: NADH-quinone oxidoreductase subunit C [Thioalkalivibrio sp.]
MSERLDKLAVRLQERFKSGDAKLIDAFGELTLEVPAAALIDTAQALHDEEGFGFEILIDVCGVDYLEYGVDEWSTEQPSSQGFSRGVEKASFGRFTFDDVDDRRICEGPRFAVVYHLLSVSLNQRLRLRVFCEDNEFPVVVSVTGVWNGADWYEREAFDLYGIMFEGHPDLRRILTDYGFVGHPFRKDFPLVGHVEMRYDPDQARVIYQPVTIEPRVLVPKVIRHDHRYINESAEEKPADA